MTLGYLLCTWIDAGHGGRVLASGYKVRISDRRGVMPDVQLRDGIYAIANSLADAETFRPASFEGLGIPLSKLWG